MSAIEELVRVMREEGKAEIPSGLQVGIMAGANSLNLGGLPLNSDDLLFSEHLLNRLAISVAGAVNNSRFDDKTTYSQPLKAGDQVAVVRVSDRQYIVLGKLVRA